MAAIKDICAHFRREERYEGLQIVFGEKDKNRDFINNKIEEAKKKFDLDPNVCENCYDDTQKCAFYIEFEDDYDRVAGEFFEYLIKELDIKQCD